MRTVDNTRIPLSKESMMNTEVVQSKRTDLWSPTLRGVVAPVAAGVVGLVMFATYAYAQTPPATTNHSHDKEATMNLEGTQPTKADAQAPVVAMLAKKSSTTVGDDAIREYRVSIKEEALADLRQRIKATRFPSQELVTDRSQGVQLATMKELARYWSTEYDWRKCETRLNALPQFTTKIDGVEIHFIHVRSKHENALPLIMTHGWPGSVVELLETVGPLTDPTQYGGTAADAFHLVLPSLPGYGFSGEPTELGWDAGRIAQAWAVLMKRLGYTRSVAQGGAVGASVTDFMGRQGPEGLVGIHSS